MSLLLFSVCSTLDTKSQVAILQPLNHSQSQTPTSFVRQGDISCSNAQDSSLEAPSGFGSIRCECGVEYPEFGLAPVSCGEVGGRRGRCGCGGALRCGCAGRGLCVRAASRHPGPRRGIHPGSRRVAASLRFVVRCRRGAPARRCRPGALRGHRAMGALPPPLPAPGCPGGCQRGCPIGAWRRADRGTGCAGVAEKIA